MGERTWVQKCVAKMLGLADEFAADATKRAQWAGFLRKLKRGDAPTLAAVVESVKEFLLPMLEVDGAVDRVWVRGGRWHRDG